ncbi:MAG TPA: AraC family transcriptional regulator [Solirubrobacteraceae bacterium]|nr:AraC family transcriptional regulator [Solirubrobacteraceae bacterium]
MARFTGATRDVRVRVDRIGGCRPPLVRGPHTHEYYTVVLFDEPGGRHELEGAPCPVRAGSVAVIPPGSVHDIGPWPGATVSFMPDALGGTRPPVEPWSGDAPPAAHEELRETIAGLERELREQKRGFRAAARAQLSLLLVALSRLRRDEPPTHPVLREVLDVIDRGFHQPLSLEAIAARVNRSPRQLTRVVRAVTGKTVMGLVEDRRMEEARRLLLETDAKVELVARRVGFHDGGYFRRRFRSVHGASPTEWRRANG